MTKSVTGGGDGLHVGTGEAFRQRVVAEAKADRRNSRSARKARGCNALHMDGVTCRACGKTGF